MLGSLVAFAVWSYLRAPVGGDFAWSDAPRHALNGIFVHDLVAHLGEGILVPTPWTTTSATRR